MGEIYRLPLSVGGRRYTVAVGPGALAAEASRLAQWWGERRLFVVSTPRVLALHGASLRRLFGSSPVHELAVPEGEAAKTLDVAADLWRRMLRAGGKRDSRVLAFGGGSVGDLGGFVAACFLRGVELVQIPTTLLAQVDAAVGGKTGVDLPEGKNTVGAFHHPARVVADTGFLATLDRAEIRSGLVEVIKMAALLDPDLFGRVEASLPQLLDGEPEALAPVVAGAVQAKIRIVEEDPEESDRRRLLNFGHTLGHALEAAGGYTALRHGEAVAYGMLFALRLARRRGLEEDDQRRIERLLDRLQLPPLPGVAGGALLAAMRRDKKARESGLAWVLPRSLGAGQIVENVDWEEVETELAGFLRALRTGAGTGAVG